MDLSGVRVNLHFNLSIIYNICFNLFLFYFHGKLIPQGEVVLMNQFLGMSDVSCSIFIDTGMYFMM